MYHFDGQKRESSQSFFVVCGGKIELKQHHIQWIISHLGRLILMKIGKGWWAIAIIG